MPRAAISTPITDARIRAALTAETVGRKVYPLSAEESDSGLTDGDIVDWHRPWGDLRRYVENVTPLTTDMTAAIQAAVDAAPIVLIPDAGHLVTSSINISSPVMMIGEGVGKSIIQFTPTVPGDYLFVFGGTDHCEFRGLELLGPGRATGTGEVCFDMFTTVSVSEYHTVIENCKIKDWNKAGVYLGGQWCVTIRNNYFQTCGDTTNIPTSIATYSGGIVFEENGGASNWSGSTNLIEANSFISASYGIYNQSGWNVVLLGNVFEYCRYPYFKSSVGTMMIDIASWMEDHGDGNYLDPVIEGEVLQMSGRSVDGSSNPKLHMLDNAGAVMDFTSYAGTQDCKAQIECTRFNVSDQSSILRFKTMAAAGGLVTRLQIDRDGNIEPGVTDTYNLGASDTKFAKVYATEFRPGDSTAKWTSGAGTPEGSVTAEKGSLYTRTDGGAGTVLYVKESGSGNTGWAAK